MMKSLCLINPGAGKKTEEEFRTILENHGHWGTIDYYRLCPDEIENPPWKDSLSKYQRVFIAGGDGTLHHVLQNFIGSGMELVILPGGTANDLCYNIGFAGDLPDYLEKLSRGEVIEYDTLEINGKHIITGGGFGLGCEVAEFCNRLKNWKLGPVIKKTLGKNIYPLTLFIMGLLNYLKPMKVHMKYHNGESRFKTYAILLANQEYMGRKVKIAPGTKNGDGRFQLIRFDHNSNIKVIFSLLLLKLGVKISPKKLYRRELKTLELEFSGPVKAYGDGEIFEPAARWKISCHKAALNIRVPA